MHPLDEWRIRSYLEDISRARERGFFVPRAWLSPWHHAPKSTSNERSRLAYGAPMGRCYGAAMSYGYLAGLLIHGSLALLSLAAPRRPRALAGLGYRVATVYNELPSLFVILLLAFSIEPVLDGSLFGPEDRVNLVLLVVVLTLFVVIGMFGARARPAVQRALDEGLGPDWRTRVEPRFAHGLKEEIPLANILFFPFVLRPRDVRKVANLHYGDAGRRNLLDLYHHASRPDGAPVLLYFHPGGYYSGRKSVEARALLLRLAGRGWVTISSNYRLRPEADFFDHLIDVKKVIAWVREHAHEYGADPTTLFLAGGSAGGHMSSIAAQTQNDPRYQPGFEDADTSVTAVASFYGWYGGYYGMGGAASEVGPLGHDAGSAPPFFIAHGENDTLAHVETARRFVSHLRDASPSPVVYAELPKGQHNFDLFHSFRSAAVVDGFEAFASWVRSNDRSSREVLSSRRPDAEAQPYPV